MFPPASFAPLKSTPKIALNVDSILHSPSTHPIELGQRPSCLEQKPLGSPSKFGCPLFLKKTPPASLKLSPPPASNFAGILCLELCFVNRNIVD
jgi:hypothetical protein